MIMSGAAFAQGPVCVEVYKSTYCGCCGKWVEHLRKNGFDVVTKDREKMGEMFRFVFQKFHSTK